MASLLKSAAFGAGLMYFFDPNHGARRRALLRDACVRLTNEIGDAFDVTRRDMSNRAHGWKHEISQLFAREPEHVSDAQLVARVRSILGRVCSHPRAIEVSANNSRVTLRGPVLSSEAQQVFDGVRSVRGVQHVENQMEQHADPGNIPALQGGRQRPGALPDILQETWSPSTRLLFAAGSLGLLASASLRGNFLTPLLGGIGLATLVNSGAGISGRGRQGAQIGQRRATRQQGQAGRRGGQQQQRAGRFDIGGLSDTGAPIGMRESGNEMRVSDLMTPSPATCTSDTKLQEVAQLMLRCDCGAIPVVDPATNLPVGVITDRDITIRTVAEGRNPLELSARDCMSSPVETISVDSSLEECLNRMEASQLRRMIVVDQDNKVCGIVAQADIAMYGPEGETAELVKDVSSPSPAATI